MDINWDKTGINRAIFEAYKSEGYIKPNGLVKDMDRMLEPVLAVLAERPVHKKGQRKQNAVGRDELVAITFPSLPNPEQIEELDEDLRPLAQIVYDQLYKDVWAEMSTGPHGRLQRMIGATMGNGWFLARTRIHSNRVDSIYLTDDPECIRLDVTRPINDALGLHIQNSTEVMKMVIERLGGKSAKPIITEFQKTLGNNVNNAAQDVQLAIEAASAQTEDAA